MTEAMPCLSKAKRARVDMFQDDMESVTSCATMKCEDEVFASPLQRAGIIRDVFGEHVLGTMSYLYSIDPGRTGLRDAATEMRNSDLGSAAVVCCAWFGCAHLVIEWERQRYADEKRLLLDAYVHPLTPGVHLAPCAEPGDELGSARFARLPFKEGDVLILDVRRLAAACKALRDESPAEPLDRLMLETARVVKSVEGRQATVVPTRPWPRRTVTPPEGLFFEDLAIGNGAHLVRCRVARFNAVALPKRRRAAWYRARGPCGRVVVEIGVERRRLDDEPLFEFAGPHDTSDVAVPCAEDLRPTDPVPCRLSTSAGGFSLPLPLLEPGVIVRVVPACYRAPVLDWPSLHGRPLALGSTFCAIKGRPQLLIGYHREVRRGAAVMPPDTDLDDDLDDDFDNLEEDYGVLVVPPNDNVTRVRHVLHVRDAASGESTSGEAAYWGMAQWNRGDLDVYDDPRPPPLGAGDSGFVPASLAHLLIDHSDRTAVCATPGGLWTDCLVCGRRFDAAHAHTLPCDCAVYCCHGHMKAHQQEHERWCPRCPRRLA